MAHFIAKKFRGEKSGNKKKYVVTKVCENIRNRDIALNPLPEVMSFATPDDDGAALSPAASSANSLRSLHSIMSSASVGRVRSSFLPLAACCFSPY